MKKSGILLLVVLFIGTVSIQAQFLKEAKKLVKKSSSGLSEEDAAAGIKEALTKGISHGVELVSKKDGYFADATIKIPFPSEAKTMEDKLRSVGLGKKVDEVVLSINRAAEDAAVKAKDIFISAIKSMTLKDATNIVKGSDDAATKYLQTNTTAELTIQFSPIIKESLQKVNATKYWSDLINTYNKIPFVKKMNPNLTEYVTQKAIEGLFVKIALEEKDIRKNPAAQTTALLKKVFGK